MDPNQRQLVWQRMLDADFRNRYWGHMAQRYLRYELDAKIFLAIMSSSVVATWILNDTLTWLWKPLSSVSAILAIALPVFDLPSVAKNLMALQSGWKNCWDGWALLWTSQALVTPEAAKEEIRRLMTEEEKVVPAGWVPKNDATLAADCQKEVLRGMPK